MAEIIIYVFQALYIFLSAFIVGYPLYRKIYQITSDGLDLIRLVCFSFGFGAAILFFAAFLISYAPFGRGALAVAVTTILPAWILYRHRIDFIKLKGAINGLFYIWAVFCAVMLFLSVSIVKISIYPGLISGTAGLGDQIEYSQIAHKIFSEGEYTVPYVILDFANNPQELKQSAQDHKLLSHIWHRLPFTPYLTSLYLYIFNRDNEKILHSTLTILLALYSAALSGVIFTWLVAIGRNVVNDYKNPYYALSFISIACLYTIFPQEFLIGCFEIITLYYLLILWTLFFTENGFGKYRTLAAFLATTTLFFNKGEGAVAIACLVLVILAPKIIKTRRQGLKTAVSYVLFLALSVPVISPWILGSMKNKVASNFSFRQYQVDCENKAMIMDYGWFLEYINNKYGASVDRCDPIFFYKTKDEFLQHAPDTSHLVEYEADTFLYHLDFIRKNKKNIYLFSYMMGSQADIYAQLFVTQNDSSLAKAEYFFKSVKLHLNKAKQQIESTVSYIGWRLPLSSVGSVIAYSLFDQPWNRVIHWSGLFIMIAATCLHPRIFISPLIFFILYGAILILLNAGVIHRPRFMLLYSPGLFLAMILVFIKVKFISEVLKSRVKYIGLGIVVLALTTHTMFLETQEIKVTKRSESHFEHIAEVIREITEPDSIIASSLPQYISGLTNRQAIGHSQFFMFLPGIIENFRPDYILFYRRPDTRFDPDFKFDEYNVGAIPYEVSELHSLYTEVMNDPARKFRIFKRSQNI